MALFYIDQIEMQTGLYAETFKSVSKDHFPIEVFLFCVGQQTLHKHITRSYSLVAIGNTLDGCHSLMVNAD